MYGGNNSFHPRLDCLGVGWAAHWLFEEAARLGGDTRCRHATIESIPKKAEKSEPPVLLTAHDLRH